MIDKNFEIDTDGGVDAGGFSFKTFSDGWSNADQLPMYSAEEEMEFNERYLKYIREFAEKVEVAYMGE